MSERNYWNTGFQHRTSRRGLLRAGAMGGAGLAGLALIGCGDDDDPDPTRAPATQAPSNGATEPPATSTPSEPASGEPRAGGTLGMPNGAPQENFNPVVNTGDANGLTAWHVYDRPLRASLDAPGYELYAAESVEVPDELTVVMVLQEGLVYQDREPVNGRGVLTEDIALLHEYARDEERTIDKSFQTEFLDTMETPDDRTIIFHLKQPDGYLFTGTHLGWPHNNCIIPSELTLGDLDTMEPVGSGPYMLDDYQFGVRYEYVKSPTWREADQGLPYIERRVRLPLTDSAALETAFRGEQIHVLIPTADQADAIVADLDDSLDVTEFTALNLYTWNMSSDREIFNDERVREAFYRNYDAEEMIELVASGWAVKATGKVAQGLEPYVLDASESEEFLRFDREAARQLLDAAGWDFDQTYVNTTLTSPVNNTAVEVFSEQLRQIGIDTSIDVRPASEWLPNVAATGDYDFSGGVGHPAYDAPGRAMRLHHSNTLSHHHATNIRDPQIDAMIEEAEVTVDREANIELVKEIQRELLRRYAHLSYNFTLRQRELRWNYVRDWEFNNTNAVMYRTEAWLDA